MKEVIIVLIVNTEKVKKMEERLKVCLTDSDTCGANIK